MNWKLFEKYTAKKALFIIFQDWLLFLDPFFYWWRHISQLPVWHLYSLWMQQVEGKCRPLWATLTFSQSVQWINLPVTSSPNNTHTHRQPKPTSREIKQKHSPQLQFNHTPVSQLCVPGPLIYWNPPCVNSDETLPDACWGGSVSDLRPSDLSGSVRGRET